MTEKNKEIMKIVGVVVLVAWAVYLFLPKNVAVKPQDTSKTEALIQKDGGAVGDLFPERKKLMDLVQADNVASEIAVNSSWGERNPFDGVASKAFFASPDPVVRAPSKDTKLVLSGILWSGPRPNAIINNNVVGVGGEVNGFTVKEIKEGIVVLNNGTEEIVLSMRHE